MNEEFEIIQKEVKTLADKIIKLTETDEQLKHLYKGTQIYMSPIQIKPEIMFLGINPGAGHYIILPSISACFVLAAS